MSLVVISVRHRFVRVGKFAYINPNRRDAYKTGLFAIGIGGEDGGTVVALGDFMARVATMRPSTGVIQMSQLSKDDRISLLHSARTFRFASSVVALGALMLGSACAPDDSDDSDDSVGEDEDNLTATGSFQNGVSPSASYAGTTDTILDQSNPNTNFGSGASLRIDGDEPAGTRRNLLSLLRFELSSIPTGSTVSAASIELNLSNASSTGVYYVYALKRAFSESQATWNQAASGQAWQSPGARGANDRSSTSLGTITTSATGKYTLALNADGVAQVKAWIANPATNFGVALDNAANWDGLEFASSEATTAASRVKLNVTYTTPTAPPPPPPPASNYGAGSAAVGSACANTAHTVTPSMTSSAVQSVLNAAGNAAYICFAAGTYNITTALAPKQGQTLHGSAGTILKGSIVLSGFGASGSNFVVSNVALPSSGSQASAERWCEDDVKHPCSYQEDVFLDGVPQTRVTSTGELGAGKFYIDYGSKSVWLGSNPSGKTVEMTKSDAAIRVTTNDVILEGLTVKHFSHAMDRGAIEVTKQTNNVTVRNCESYNNHGAGLASWGSNFTMKYNRLHDNGQQGASIGQNTGALIDHNDINHNNIDGFWRIDGASGGIKLDLFKKATITWNKTNDNLNHGIWLDDNGNDAIIQNNDVENNFSSGILFEVSNGAKILDNLVIGNGLGDSTARGHVGCKSIGCSGGIMVNTSPNVEIARNTIRGNSNPIALLQTSRSPRTSEIIISNMANINVHDNIITAGAGVTGVKNQGPSGYDVYTKNIVFTANKYTLPSSGAASFYWQNAAKTAAQWKAFGLDTTGTFN